MIRKVLIVDDNQEMLQSLRSGLEKYGDTFTVVLASDGQEALEKLKSQSVSLVVTDLKMPRMDGFTLLALIMEHYPDIPVIIITAYSTPEMERLAKEGGAVGYIEKPFMIPDLARKILGALRRESEGGTLHNVSSTMFLQLIEMEQKTCTIRITDRRTGRQGVLFFNEGDLFQARMERMEGEEAAQQIFSWDDVNIAIQNSCPQREKRIQSDLQAILLEAMRLKDEGMYMDEATLIDPEPEVAETPVEIMATDTMAIRGRIEESLGARCGVGDVYLDTDWDPVVAVFDQLGEAAGGGSLKAIYMDRGEVSDYILLPGPETAVVTLNPKSPRDRILEVLTR